MSGIALPCSGLNRQLPKGADQVDPWQVACAMKNLGIGLCSQLLAEECPSVHRERFASVARRRAHPSAIGVVHGCGRVSPDPVRRDNVVEIHAAAPDGQQSQFHRRHTPSVVSGHVPEGMAERVGCAILWDRKHNLALDSDVHHDDLRAPCIPVPLE